MSRQETKQRILEEGARLIHTKGFNDTGILDVLKAAGVPKGSFYFYFQNKEEFGLEIVEYFRGHFCSLAQQHMEASSGTTMERLAALFIEFEQMFEAQGFRLGCPIGNLASELGDVNDRFQERLASVFAEMRDSIATFLVAAIEAGEIDRRIDARRTADYLLQGWEGALVLMKVSGDAGPLFTFRQTTFEFMGLDPKGRPLE